jgi:hypothetical protein
MFTFYKIVHKLTGIESARNWGRATLQAVSPSTQELRDTWNRAVGTRGVHHLCVHVSIAYLHSVSQSGNLEQRTDCTSRSHNTVTARERRKAFHEYVS